MSNGKKALTFPSKQQSTESAETSHEKIAQFISGEEPETTKTFRLPVSLGRRLRIVAAQLGQTEKEILTRLIADFVTEHEQ